MLKNHGMYFSKHVSETAVVCAKLHARSAKIVHVFTKQVKSLLWLNSSRTRFPRPRELAGRHVAQCTVWPAVVIVRLPGPGQRASMSYSVELIRFHELILACCTLYTFSTSSP